MYLDARGVVNKRAHFYEVIITWGKKRNKRELSRYALLPPGSPMLNDGFWLRSGFITGDMHIAVPVSPFTISPKLYE